MSDDSTTTGETTAADDQQSRAERAAELTHQAQALFGLGVVKAHFEDHRGAIEHMALAASLFNEARDRDGEAWGTF